MLDPNQEIMELEDLLPASWRMQTKVFSGYERLPLISSNLPKPWNRRLKVNLNFRQWQELSRSERDLLFLQEVAGRLTPRWLTLGLDQALTLLALVATAWQFSQSDLGGAGLGILLTLLAGDRLRRQQTGLPARIKADQETLQIAQRRGYSSTQAAKALLQGLAKLHERQEPGLDYLIRCEHLRAIATRTEIGVPD
ncbi:MAG: DUF3318 domain-containing protein [Pseudanabaenaceae cyanobacterium bins.68]|nr:DUF3318 domain-containing protein [Pseudanabaenaceae cyanobacterium bins.68]